MENESIYTVEITAEAEQYYFAILEYFYEHHSEESADEKSHELLAKAISLESNPTRGRIEDRLQFLGRNHRFILFFYVQRKAIKIIYYIDEKERRVYVTDFFPCENDDVKIGKRSL